MKFLKVGRVAIITRGRYAGKKHRHGRRDARLKRQRCSSTASGASVFFAKTRTHNTVLEQSGNYYGSFLSTRPLDISLQDPQSWHMAPQIFLQAEPTTDSAYSLLDPCILILTLQVVIIQPVDNGNKPHPFGHAVVAGIERYPSKITRRMSKARQEKRSKVKPFIKVINYNHLMPTRYTLELEGLKGSVTADTFKEVSHREDAKKTVKKALEERYSSGKNRWFFTPLSTFFFFFCSLRSTWGAWRGNKVKVESFG
ncbi:60S ribosomal protein L27 [Cordyceps militaris CM01]|uniref:60S ribosomal protein L27 n=1 Tax=Cordyceps militaris (strain CM01) TaxID=983644 RepID=G3J330_CORMM|nr:60S ribosomal protein L27 [Cordyceps militaris CM01]EGX95613.1 60S ribosomal protein L27 [Cordyceps militaris CM01]